MAQTKIKAGQFFGVIGHGTDGYFLMTNADGSMSWSQASTGPSVTSVTYPGDDTAADPAGGQTVVLTGTNFGSSMTVSIGGTTAPSVAHDSSTQLTITTPAKAAGDYDIVVTNTVTGASGTFVNGISYNGIPTWTTAAGSLGTFESETTISTITLQATEPDGGTITFNITNGALPSGLSLTGANIDGTTTAESSTTLYSFTIEAIDNENQSTPRNFSITVNSAAIISSENFTINTYTGNGSTLAIEGKIGTAASFNGSSSNVEVQGISGMGANDFTYSCWFNTNSIAASNFNILTPYTKDHLFYGIQVYSSTIGAYALNSSGGGQYIISNSGTISTGTWYHVAYVKSSTAGHILYLNGSVVASDSNFTGNMYNPAGYNSLWIGNAQNLQYFNGSIDQVRVFNKALSSSEVTTLYGENNTSLTKSTTDIFNDGSGIALYEFEKGGKDTGGVTGYIGGGGIFNGSSSRIDTGYNPGTDSSYSISIWMNTTVTSTRQFLYGILPVSGSNNGPGLGFGVTATNNFELYLGNGSTFWNDATVSASSYTDGDWHHLVLVVNGTSVKLFADGNTTPIANLTSTISAGFSGGTNLEIGRFGSYPGIYYNGKLDQVRIFNKAISSSEVTTLYGETSASATKSTTDIFDDGSGVALYELEGNADTTTYYPYGEGAIDSGQSAVFNRTGNGNTTSSAIYLPNNSFNSVTSYSLSAWVNMPNFANNGYVVFSNYFYNGSNEFGYKIYTNTSGNLVVDNWSPSLTRITSGSSLSVNTWHNIVITNTQSQIKIYIDGVLDSTNSTSGYAIDTTMLYTIGGTQYNNLIYDGFNGKIDQVRIYSSILSASDVEALVSETSVPTSNLIAHYKLDGNANDETGNYNATSVNNVTYSDPAEFPLIAYNGTATNVTYAYDGTPTNVSFVGTSFQPDLVWIKDRDNNQNNHHLFDIIRGTNVRLMTNLTNAQNTEIDCFNSFDSNGFSLGSNQGVNYNGNNFVAWCWKAGGVPTPNNNTQGTITSTVSANQDAGFSIVKWTGDLTLATIGHGLSQTPELIFLKNASDIEDWEVMYDKTSPTYSMQLNSTIAGRFSNYFRSVGITTFGVGNYNRTNGSSDNMIAYCFHSVDGYQKVGSYTGTNATNAVTTGFEPRFLMVKLTSAIDGQWVMYDYARSGSNPRTKKLAANSNIEENNSSSLGGDSVHQVNFTSTGFELLETSGGVNTNKLNETYIYLAIA